MNEILEQTLLYDFYGELLTEHQKQIYEQYVSENLSLREIAEDAGISRQGVHDLIKRCNRILEDYEKKLHLVKKFVAIRKQLSEVNGLLDLYEKQGDLKIIGKIRSISKEILEEL